MADGGIGVAEGDVAADTGVGYAAGAAWATFYAGVAAEGAHQFSGGASTLYDRAKVGIGNLFEGHPDPAVTTNPSANPQPGAPGMSPARPNAPSLGTNSSPATNSIDPDMTVVSSQDATKNIGKIAKQQGYSPQQTKDAIHQVKNEASWRGYGANKNPDVAVDRDGEVYPVGPDGKPSEDSIGNIGDHLERPGRR